MGSTVTSVPNLGTRLLLRLRALSPVSCLPTNLEGLPYSLHASRISNFASHGTPGPPSSSSEDHPSSVVGYVILEIGMLESIPQNVICLGNSVIADIIRSVKMRLYCNRIGP